MSNQELAAKSTVDKRSERVRTMFAGVARRYDLLNHLLSLNIDKRWRRTTLAKAPPQPGMRVLDVCCGTGDLAILYASQNCPNVEVIGVDFCREMLEIAQTKSDRANLAIEWQEADAQALPFPDDRFDIVTCGFGLRNISDTKRGIEEMVRVTRPGGRVAILEFSRPRWKALRWLYLAYFKYVLPRIGKKVSPTSGDAYEYLPASVMEFPDGTEMTRLLESLGLSNVTFQPLTFGISTLYLGTKPNP